MRRCVVSAVGCGTECRPRHDVSEDTRLLARQSQALARDERRGGVALSAAPRDVCLCEYLAALHPHCTKYE